MVRAVLIVGPVLLLCAVERAAGFAWSPSTGGLRGVLGREAFARRPLPQQALLSRSRGDRPRPPALITLKSTTSAAPSSTLSEVQGAALLFPRVRTHTRTRTHARVV
jgi:hypothetical protein